jgi:acetolactate synthase-1/2/3 large subunit
MKLSDVVIQYFEKKGINTAFTVSGGGCIHLVDSLRKSTSIETTCVHHEQSALMASEGYYRMHNKMALNVVTTGPGGSNTLTGLMGLWLDSIPSIIISGQVQLSQLSEGTGCRQIGDQEFDILSVVRPMVKYCAMVTSPEDIYDILETAYATALNGRPGPVWIDIPLDMQAANVEDRVNESHSVLPKYEFDAREIDELKRMIESSKKPLVVVGNGIRLSDSYAKLNEFLTRYNLPVVTGPHSGVDAVDNTYEYYAGRIGILGQLSSNTIVQNCDLLIGIGTRLPVKMTGYNVRAFAPDAKKILIDIDINEMNKHTFPIDKKIVSDVGSFFDAFSDVELDLDIDPWLIFVKEQRAEQRYYYEKHETLQEYASFYYLINKAPRFFGNTPIVTSNGTAHVITLQTYNLNKDQRLFTNVGCASMGYGLPAAIGACLAQNKQPVICVEGDGSIMMNLQELQTVVSYNLPVKIILVNNDGYISIKMTQDSFFNGQRFASGRTDGVTLPDYQKIANAFGIQYFSIKNNSEIETGLQNMMEYNGPCILEVFTHPMERHEPKVTHKGIDENGRIIPGTLTDMKMTEGF